MAALQACLAAAAPLRASAYMGTRVTAAPAARAAPASAVLTLAVRFTARL
jgi:hypothetical protein